MLFIFASALPAHAKLHGCVDSPENPSAVLGLLLSASSFGVFQLRNRFGLRRKLDHK
jgi:XrtJ-associated TM-motif-TM protein